MLFTAFYFFLALLILIVVHEFGHFLVARLCGVKVLRFSFGFGKVLARWTSKRGTEYVWSAVPLGGYVKMLDETEGEVAEDEKHLAFNNQSVAVRTAVVLAGPLFNFLFAFCALWFMWVVGFKSLAPMVEEVRPNSIAAVAGLQANHEIIAVNDNTINSWRDFQYALLPLVGGDEPIRFMVKSLQSGEKSQVLIFVHNWKLESKHPDILKMLGIVPFVPKIPPIVGEVVSNTPAEGAGFKVGDKILSIDGKPIKDWLEVVELVRQQPSHTIKLQFERNNTQLEKMVVIGAVQHKGVKEGFLGLKSKAVEWPEQWLRTQRKGPFEAAAKSFKQTMDLTGATFMLLGRLVTGKIPIQALSGPVGIAYGAGESAKGGLTYYLSFLALVSISLGVLNLLPIPMLDGGHLLFYFIEILRKKPLTEEAKSVGMYLGLALLIAMMFIALSNDIMRLKG